MPTNLLSSGLTFVSVSVGITAMLGGLGVGRLKAVQTGASLFFFGLVNFGLGYVLSGLVYAIVSVVLFLVALVTIAWIFGTVHPSNYGRHGGVNTQSGGGFG